MSRSYSRAIAPFVICGWHRHRCATCGHTWEHMRDPLWTEEEEEAAHTCEKCGTVLPLNPFIGG